MSVYEERLIADIVSLRARHAYRFKDVADAIYNQYYYGIPKNVVCFQLSQLYNEVASLLADIERLGFEMGKYVGTRLVSRMEQITTSLYSLTELLQMNFISRDVYAYTKTLLDYENMVIYLRWYRFENMLRQNLDALYEVVRAVLEYIGEKMKAACYG